MSYKKKFLYLKIVECMIIAEIWSQGKHCGKIQLSNNEMFTQVLLINSELSKKKSVSLVIV